jgi:hypothetical protein
VFLTLTLPLPDSRFRRCLNTLESYIDLKLSHSHVRRSGRKSSIRRGRRCLHKSSDSEVCQRTAKNSFERNTSRERARLTSPRAMVIKPILAEEISENPYCSGNLEGLGVFTPIRMTVGIRKNQRYPHQ